MEQQNLESLKAELANLPIKVEPIGESKYRLEATVEQVYHLRRYLHLNYPVQILVNHTSQSLKALGDKPLAEADVEARAQEKISCVFYLEPRNPSKMSTGLYNTRLFEINPQYDNVRHHTTSPVGEQQWDQFEIVQEAQELELGSGSTVCITGGIEGFNRTQVEQMLGAVGINVAKTVSSKVDALIKGTSNKSEASSKAQEAEKLGIYIIEGKQLKKLMDALSKEVYGG